MPRRLGANRARQSAAAPTTLDPPPIANLSTPSPAKSTRSSARSSASGTVTPATSLDEAHVDLKVAPRRSSRRSARAVEEDRDETDDGTRPSTAASGVEVVIHVKPRRSGRTVRGATKHDGDAEARKDATPAGRHASRGTAGTKRGRKSASGKAEAALSWSDNEDSKAIPTEDKEVDEVLSGRASSAEDEAADVPSTSKTRARPRSSGSSIKSTARTSKNADVKNEQHFENAAGWDDGGAEDVKEDDDEDDVPLATRSSNGRKRAAPPRAAGSKRARTSADPRLSESEEDDEDWAEEEEEEGEDSDFAPRSWNRRNRRGTASRRRGGRKGKERARGSDDDEEGGVSGGASEAESEDAWIARAADEIHAAWRDRDVEAASRSDTSDLSSGDESDDATAAAAAAAAAGASSTAPAGSAREDERYETAKQRAKRLKREARERRANENARRTGRSRRSRMSQYEKNKAQLVKHHPELDQVWKRLKKQPLTPTIQAKQPEGLNVKLLPFQLEGLNWLSAQEKGAWKGGILADEMGMGKTVQMIALFLTDRKKPTLVVAPTVAIMQWRSEIQKYTRDFRVLVWHGASRTNEVKLLQQHDVILTSYAVLESSFRKQESGFRRKGAILKEQSVLHQIHWHRIILDEAHNIKERATNTAKGAFELKGNYRWCLSGTPLQNRVGELYSMIRFLGGDPYSFYYCKRCTCKQLHWMFSDRRHCDACGHTPMHHTCFWNNEILKPIQKMGPSLGEGHHAYKRLRLLLERMMLRRTKLERADDMGLPPRTIIVRQDLFNEEEEDLYTSLYQDTTRKFSTYLDQGTVLNNYSNIFTLLTRMRQMACHPDLVLRSKTGLTQKLLGDAQNDGIHVCRICTDEAEDPIMSKCKHVFCRLCVTEYMESDIVSARVEAGGVPECPYCHATLTIDLEAEALEPPAQQSSWATARQGILQHLDLDRWRSSTKIEALVEELTKLRAEDRTIKSLVFSQFVNFLDLIALRLSRAGFRVVRLEGGMSPEARDRTIQAFNNDVNISVFLISLRAGGVGLNLTPASRVFIMDPWWNSALATQAMDRIHRLGQHRPIVVHQMIIADSIESRILELQAKKASMIESTLGKDESALGRLTVADLGFLFAM